LLTESRHSRRSITGLRLRDHEYKRYGTVSLLAGIDLLTSKVHALVRDRHRSREFKREQRIAELEHEIDRLQRTEEAIVVATGAPRERGCPPWVVLGVKAVEARPIEAA
jgi:hypothetical protein